MPDGVISWTEVPGTGLHVADRGGFTIVRTPGRRWRLHRNGESASIAYARLGLAMAAAEDLLPKTEEEIVLTNPPEGDDRSDPPATGSSTTPAPPAPTTEKRSVQLPRFIRVRRPAVKADGKPLRTWL